MELQRQKVKDLPSAYATTKVLIDFRGERQQGFRSRSPSFVGQRPKFQTPDWLEKRPRSKKDQPTHNLKPITGTFEARIVARKGERPKLPQSNVATIRPRSIACFRCGGPYFMSMS